MWRSKRLLGGLNMMLFRRRQLRNEYLPLFVEHILKQPHDAVLVSGDLTTTALADEFRLARTYLQPLIDQGPFFTIPGNHDVYTMGAARENRYEHFFGDCHSKGSKEAAQGAAEVYPYAGLVEGGIVVIGVNTCVPTGLTGAWGIVDALQLERLGALLEEHKGQTRVVMMHHFLQDHHGTPGTPSRWIRNRGELLEVLAQHGAELIIHGHKHDCYHYTVDGTDGPIPVFNAGPTTWHHEQPEMQGGYHIYELADGALQRCLRYRFDPGTRRFQELVLWSRVEEAA